MKFTKSHLRKRWRDNYLDDVSLLSSTNISPDVEELLNHLPFTISNRILFVARDLLYLFIYLFILLIGIIIVFWFVFFIIVPAVK